MNITSLLEKNPIIYAVNNTESLRKAADSKADVIFLLKSDISQLKKDVLYAHDRDKKIFVHLDLADGLGRDEAAVSFIADFIKPDGIITTRSQLIRAAKQRFLSTVFRVFTVDSQGVKTALDAAAKTECDFIEVMPGVIPSVIKRLSSLNKPLIAGGLISSKEEISAALKAGALAVSTSDASLF